MNFYIDTENPRVGLGYALGLIVGVGLGWMAKTYINKKNEPAVDLSKPIISSSKTVEEIKADIDELKKVSIDFIKKSETLTSKVDDLAVSVETVKKEVRDCRLPSCLIPAEQNTGGFRNSPKIKLRKRQRK